MLDDGAVPRRASIEQAVRPKTSELDDAELVSAARERREMFAHLYYRYADRLYRYAFERTGSREVADDVVSDTMLAALEGLNRFDPSRGTVAAWLFTIASRRIVDHHRAWRRFWNHITRRRLPGIATQEDVLQTIMRTEDEHQLRRAFGTLSEEDQQLILLRYSADLSSKEVGMVCGISPGAARTRLSRAMKRLNAALCEDDKDNVR